jgi:hypothetical protein
MRITKHAKLLMVAVAAIAVGHISDGDARGSRGGGGRAGGGARTSVSRGGGGFSGGARGASGGTRSYSGANRSTASANRSATSRNVDRSSVTSNRNVNRNVNRDVDVHGDRGYYGYGGRYWGGAPVARGVAAGAAFGLTAAAVGSVAYSLPTGCGLVGAYYRCGHTYYAPQYSGDQVTYVVVESPEED